MPEECQQSKDQALLDDGVLRTVLFQNAPGKFGEPSSGGAVGTSIEGWARVQIA